MNDSNLVSAARLNDLITAGGCRVVDCRFDFSDGEKARSDWQAGHIPGAVYAHMDEDLAAPVTATTGRHPLPETEKFAAWLASVGWSPGQLLVAYDEASGALASRLWWMMRYYGQPAALLDGGLKAWTAAELPLESGAVAHPAAEPADLRPNSFMTVSADDIFRNLGRPELVVLDARARERYTGKVEFLDSAAGHIPGALSRPFDRNLGADGRFLSAAELEKQFEATLGGTDPARIAHSCGSGVTACHNLFAMELAGLGGSRLYPGSWSEWIRDPERPIATGSEA
jgi:thiosulfate/3-mercaptopyruvate sulfurtransferase